MGAYEMFTTKGNVACQGLVNKTARRIKGVERITKGAVEKLLKEGIKKIEKNHPEVGDSEPPRHIAFGFYYSDLKEKP